jgi:DNA-binding PadR family transcriptional regulator
MENLKIYESFIEEINEANAQKGLMHKLLEIPEGDKISSVYKNTEEGAEELAHDLLTAVKKAGIVPIGKVRSKATSMLAFAGNWPSEGKNTVIDKALKAIKNIEIPGVPIK